MSTGSWLVASRRILLAPPKKEKKKTTGSRDYSIDTLARALASSTDIFRLQCNVLQVTQLEEDPGMSLLFMTLCSLVTRLRG